MYYTHAYMHIKYVDTYVSIYMCDICMHTSHIYEDH